MCILHLIRSKMEDYTYYWLSEHGKYELERNQSYINLIINESNKKWKKRKDVILVKRVN